MFEKVNPSHPDKVADRIAGAIVDLAYKTVRDPRVAVEVLIGHGNCHIINETSVKLDRTDVEQAVYRIAGDGIKNVDYLEVAQDNFLAGNQMGKIKCGDNGIFCGVPVCAEERHLVDTVKRLYDKYPCDGKFIIYAPDSIIACQSNVDTDELRTVLETMGYKDGIINPLGSWTGGTDVDTGATNRKLGSDMGEAVTGGGLHGKDLSKADVSVNIYAHLKAQWCGHKVSLHCAIGDEYIDDLPYSAIVEVARDYIDKLGGFEKFAEYGLLN